MRHRSDDHDQETRPRRRLRVTIGAAVVLLVAAFVVAVLVSVAAAGGGGSATVAAAGKGRSSATPAAASGSPGASSLFVHVAGAVRAPGLVELQAGARVVDAVAAAGGLAEAADADGINLARPVQDGEQLRVPHAGEAAPPAAAGAPSDSVIDLNAATQDQLEELPRIGPALAQRILEWRTANGGFASVDDLMQVTGIGQKVFDGLKDRVRV